MNVQASFNHFLEMMRSERNRMDDSSPLCYHIELVSLLCYHIELVSLLCYHIDLVSLLPHRTGKFSLPTLILACSNYKKTNEGLNLKQILK